MAEAFDDGPEQTISIQEYLKGVEEQELDRGGYLGYRYNGAKFHFSGFHKKFRVHGKECTYSQGYMKRQPIFSCLTCTPGGNAGVCTACCLSCHDGHEIVELWTKRNFRCDCGNSKFGNFICNLFSNKDVENGNNSYICNRPYPDPDVEEQVEMIQCCMCEDWFHEEHLGLSSIDEIPRDEEGEPLYEDFICLACSAVCSFLSHYPSSIWVVGTSSDIDVSTNNNAPEPTVSVKSANVDLTAAPNKSADSLLSELPENKSSSNESIKDKNRTDSCVLGTFQSSVSAVVENKAMFLSKNWRDALCRCEKCVDSYKVKNISFLLDKEDSIAEYEKIAKQKREEKLHEQEEKIKILNGIADMKDEIHILLESLDSSKPITSAEIHRVNANLAERGRRTE